MKGTKWREEERRRTAVEVAYVTAALTDRFQKEKAALLSESRQSLRWRKPEHGVFKVADGAFDCKSASQAVEMMTADCLPWVESSELRLLSISEFVSFYGLV